MDQKEYHEAVAAEVARLARWPIDDARRYIGGPEDMAEAIADGMSASDYASEILAAGADG